MSILYFVLFLVLDFSENSTVLPDANNEADDVKQDSRQSDVDSNSSEASEPERTANNREEPIYETPTQSVTHHLEMDNDGGQKDYDTMKFKHQQLDFDDLPTSDNSSEYSVEDFFDLTDDIDISGDRNSQEADTVLRRVVKEEVNEDVADNTRQAVFDKYKIILGSRRMGSEFLNPTVDHNELHYKHPQMPTHPFQIHRHHFGPVWNPIIPSQPYMRIPPVTLYPNIGYATEFNPFRIDAMNKIDITKNIIFPYQRQYKRHTNNYPLKVLNRIFRAST